jgi:hypothetical protein
MGKRAPNTLARCLVERAQHVIDVADVELRVLFGDLVSASISRFAFQKPSTFVGCEFVDVHKGIVARQRTNGQ